METRELNTFEITGLLSILEDAGGYTGLPSCYCGKTDDGMLNFDSACFESETEELTCYTPKGCHYISRVGLTKGNDIVIVFSDENSEYVTDTRIITYGNLMTEEVYNLAQYMWTPEELEA